MDICRLCLTEDQVLRPIFDPLQESSSPSFLINKITDCLPVTIGIDDALPKQICEICINVVEEFYEFRNNVVQSQKVLENVDQNSTNLEGYNEISIGPASALTLKEELEVNGLIGSVMEELEDETAANENEDSLIELSETSPENCSTNCVSESEHSIILNENSSSFSNPESFLQDPLGGSVDEPESTAPITENLKNKSCKKESLGSKTIAGLKRTNRNYCCEVCKKKFISPVQLSRHSSIHNKSYSCSICSYTNISASNFRIHMMKHNGQFLVTCQLCGKGFYNKQYYKDHYHAKHSSDISTNTCQICHSTFRSRSYLNIHLKSHSPNDNKKSYQCELCGKLFESYRGMKRHSLSIHEGCRYKCDECGKEVSSLESLKKHKMIHSGKISFVCEICGKGFIAHNNLIVHKRTHSGEQPFKCDECPKSFTQKSTLDTHKRYHQGLKIFECGICNKSFVSKILLRHHEKNH